jgi:hypothetical protein
MTRRVGERGRVGHGFDRGDEVVVRPAHSASKAWGADHEIFNSAPSGRRRPARRLRWSTTESARRGALYEQRVGHDGFDEVGE